MHETIFDDIRHVVFPAISRHFIANPRLSVLAISCVLLAFLIAFKPLPETVFEAMANKQAHFYLDVEIDDQTTLNMMLDTGATYISLAPHDAQALGFDPATLNYNLTTNTANGKKKVAAVTLSKVSIKGIVVYDVPARITRSGLKQSLLGMSFLKHVDIEITGRKLTLRKS